MSQKPIGRVLKRTRKREFGKHNPLPFNLSYLEGIPFYAVTRCKLPSSDYTQVRIEILPRYMKTIALSFKALPEIIENQKILISDMQKLENENERLNKLADDLISENEALKKKIGNYLGKTPDGNKSSFEKIAETGVVAGLPPYQGGIPGSKR